MIPFITQNPSRFKVPRTWSTSGVATGAGMAEATGGSIVVFMV
jgi:hypothetical protein